MTRVKIAGLPFRHVGDGHYVTHTFGTNGRTAYELVRAGSRWHCDIDREGRSWHGNGRTRVDAVRDAHRAMWNAEQGAAA